MQPMFTRRSVLRGTVAGGAVSVALPFLDCFLNTNGTALASGGKIPVRFGTWFWGCGFSPGRAVAEKPGQGFEFLDECKALTPYRDQINYFNGYNAPTDGKSNFPHSSGIIIIRCGAASTTGRSDIPAPSFDVLISDAIGSGTRFKSIEMASINTAPSYSARSSNSLNAAEVSPVAVYTRLFGPDFVDPNSGEFKPDPRIMYRQSVLSAVKDDAVRLNARLGSADRARMDEYFTSIRQMEQQLDLQTQKPAPADACVKPTMPSEEPPSSEIETVHRNHKILAQLMAMAVACNQTKVFNMCYSDASVTMRRAGESAGHHTLTHEEPVDPKLGYQPKVSWFVQRSMGALADFIEAFASVREGGGTLLDNTLIFAHSDTSYAKFHALDSIPVMMVGKAGGRLKTGNYIHGNGAPVTSIGLTAQQVMGLPVSTWGQRSLQTSRAVTEIMV
jgi:hypothetical protein